MQRIDFYSLEPASRGDRFLLTCRLVERIRARDLRILIHCPDPTQARHLDRLLWTFREESFLPHGQAGHTDPELTPILISGSAESPDDQRPVLINLSNAIPELLDRFERLCEPVDHEHAVQNAARARYRYYREQGYRLEHHPIRL